MEFVFLLCTERSGSNLITSMFGGHRAVSGPPPSHQFRLFGLNCDNYYPTSSDENWDAFVTDFVDAAAHMIGDWDSRIDAADLRRACPDRTIAGALRHLYAGERKPGEDISFVKENYTYLIVPFLLANWPDAKFVYQVRDPRDMAASWITTFRAKGGVAEAVDTWRNDQRESLRIIRQIRSSGRTAFLRYEDLITAPEASMRKLCRAIGIDFDSNMLEYHADDRVRRNARKVSGWKNLAKPVLGGNAGKYKAGLSGADIRFIELSCAPLMETFGYAFETDAASVPPDKAHAEIEELLPLLSSSVASQTYSASDAAMLADRQKLIERVRNRIGIR